jgi:myo-inositol 2-dehydrogenase/D-chiro-inositol 1-dehydrogenase/scyllo-inositol 2-dehydrogenase (NAD+)
MPNSLRVCLVGAGRAAKVHANSLVHHTPKAELVAIVDPIPDVLSQTAAQFGVGSYYTSLVEAVQNVDFDAVVITTPTFTHKDLALTAAGAGKHIFLEKPMALNLQECDAIIQSATQNGVFLQLGFMRRFDPEFAEAERRILAGAIGQPMLIKSLTHGPGLPPPWARDLTTSNGMLAEVNSHDWDTVRWLMGSDYERVYVEVANFKGAARNVDTPNFYDNVLVNIRFENGGLGSISGVCPCDYGYDARVEIVGEKGILQIGELKGQAVLICTDRDQGLITPIYRTWPERFAWGYIREMEHFVDSILTGTPPKVGGAEGRWAVAGVLAGTRSFLENRPVYLSEVM